MINKASFDISHIKQTASENKCDPILLERSIYAFGLLEALVKVQLPFTFKGGSSLLLLLDHPRRLSTDIDIIVAPDTSIGHYIELASEIFPFKHMEEQIRVGKNNVVKRHFKFYYDSPVEGREFYILLDVLYEENNYCSLITKEIRNDLLITDPPYIEVTMPDVNCILKDKPFQRITNPSQYIDARMPQSKYGKLSYIRKMDLTSYGYLIETIRLLGE